MGIKEKLKAIGIKKKLKAMSRNSILLDVSGVAEDTIGATRLGGQPDVPPGFAWPTFFGKGLDDEERERPLTFLAQFNCAELSAYDAEHLLPDHGILSFFYEADSQPWGFSPKDTGSARVYWFEDILQLTPAEFPPDLPDDFQIPATRVGMEQSLSLPSWEDFSEAWPDEDDDDFEEAREKLGVDESYECSKLLGWPDIIQNSMAAECELVCQGYDLGGGWDHVPKNVQRQAEAIALDRWRLLLQLSTVETGEYSLYFGDCGQIYFFIPKEDLAEKRFDRVWLILQCG